MISFIVRLLIPLCGFESYGRQMTAQTINRNNTLEESKLLSEEAFGFGFAR